MAFLTFVVVVVVYFVYFNYLFFYLFIFVDTVVMESKEDRLQKLTDIISFLEN